MNESSRFDLIALTDWLSQATTVVIAGIGNPIRRDDSIGTRIVQGLRGKVSDHIYLIECETVPENFMDKIIEFNPSHILLVDAAILGMAPGEFKFFKTSQLTDFYAYSSHKLPLKIFCEYIKKMIQVDIALLLIEPGNVDFGEGLTPQVNTAKQFIIRILVELLSNLSSSEK